MKVPCPKCGADINPAALLAGAGKGGRKNFTTKERRLRAQRLAEVRAKRWPDKT